MFRPLITLSFLAVTFAAAADSAERKTELSYLRCVMPDNLLPYAHVEVPGIENIAIQGENADQHLALRVFPGQKKLNNGIRAEVSVDYPHKEGDTVRYSWSFMVPEGFKSDAPKNRWWIVAQWHDQPDKSQGETWDHFASKSPPILLGLGELNGRLGLGLNYGPSHEQKLGPIFIVPGRWHSVVAVIHWSRKGDGKATIFLDDMSKPAAVAEGPNMNNGFQHYLKLGMYRHPEIQTENWLHLDKLEISHSKDTSIPAG